MMRYVKTKKYLLAALIIVLVIGIGAGTYVGSVLWIKKIGITVKPQATHTPPSMPFFLQNDAKWEGDIMGTSQYRLGGSGCLVSSLAAALNTLDVETDPQALNNVFADSDVYTPTGEVIWYKIKDAVPGVDYHYQRIFNSRTLENDLRQGKLPIVQVRYHKKGIFHWVLIVGADDEDFLMMDPLQQDKKITRLSNHGKVYAYRVLHAREE